MPLKASSAITCDRYLNAGLPTLVYSYESQKPPKSATCDCDRRFWLAAAHLNSIASVCRDAPRSYGGWTYGNGVPNDALRALESHLASFSLRQAGVTPSEPFMKSVKQIQPHNPNANFDEALPDIVTQLSAEITKSDLYDPSHPHTLMPNSAELNSVAGYVSRLKGTPTYLRLLEALATEAKKEGRHEWVPKYAVLSKTTDPCDLMPQQAGIRGTDEHATREYYDSLLDDDTGMVWEGSKDNMLFWFPCMKYID